MPVLVEKLSSLVQQQLPEFVQADYPTFVAFMKAYYEFLEQSQGAQEVIQNARSYHDIDTTIDSFVAYFKKQYAIDIPETILADKKLFYKNIRDLYQSKGTEKGFELLFRILFNENISFFYPSTTLLKLSDGKWATDVSIKIAPGSGNPLVLSGATIVGQSSGATATIERVSQYYDGSNNVYELFLNRDSMSTVKFTAAEPITATLGLIQVTGTIYSIVESVTINSRGTGYVVGDRLTFSGGTGVNAAGRVAAVNGNGEILKLTITCFGSGYTTAPTSVTVTSSTGTGVSLTAVAGTTTSYDGYYVGVDGQLSENIKLQDGYYYQAYSYVVRVGQSVNLWRDVVKKVMHPAGMAMFGEVVVTSSANARMNMLPTYFQLVNTLSLYVDSQIRTTTFRPVLVITTNILEDGVYPNSPVKVLSVSPSEFLPVLVFPRQQQNITVATVTAEQLGLQNVLVINLTGVDSALPNNLTVGLTSSSGLEVVLPFTTSVPYSFGTTYKLIEKYKFMYSPTAAGDKGYFGTTAAKTGLSNTQIKDFADYVILDFVNNPTKKQNRCVDAHINLISP